MVGTFMLLSYVHSGFTWYSTFYYHVYMIGSAKDPIEDSV